MNKLNDDTAALSDIANAPEVSGEGQERPPLNVKMAKAEVEIDDAADERNARLLVSGVQSAVGQFTGKSLLDDQVDALSELARMGLSALRNAALPRPAYVGILGLILVVPALPALIKFITAKHKPQGDGFNV